MKIKSILVLIVCAIIPALINAADESADSKIVADGTEISEFTTGVELFEFQFAMTKEAA